MRFEVAVDNPMLPEVLHVQSQGADEIDGQPGVINPPHPVQRRPRAKLQQEIGLGIVAVLEDAH